MKAPQDFQAQDGNGLGGNQRYSQASIRASGDPGWVIELATPSARECAA